VIGSTPADGSDTAGLGRALVDMTAFGQVFGVRRETGKE
jgi:hypothetical protein